MAKAPTLSDITNMLTAGTVINNNNDLIEAAFQNTLSRDGSTPNQMGADLDLNNFDLLNVKQVDAASIKIAGTDVTASVQASEAAAALSASNAASSETAASASATEAALYDGPKVDTFAELSDVTPAMLAVGGYIRVISTNQVYKRVSDAATDEHFDYTGSGGVKMKAIPLYSHATGGMYVAAAFGDTLNSTTAQAAFDAADTDASAAGVILGGNWTLASTVNLNGLDSIIVEAGGAKFTCTANDVAFDLNPDATATIPRTDFSDTVTRRRVYWNGGHFNNTNATKTASVAIQAFFMRGFYLTGAYMENFYAGVKFGAKDTYHFTDCYTFNNVRHYWVPAEGVLYNAGLTGNNLIGSEWRGCHMSISGDEAGIYMQERVLEMKVKGGSINGAATVAGIRLSDNGTSYSRNIEIDTHMEQIGANTPGVLFDAGGNGTGTHGFRHVRIDGELSSAGAVGSVGVQTDFCRDIQIDAEIRGTETGVLLDANSRSVRIKDGVGGYSHNGQLNFDACTTKVNLNTLGRQHVTLLPQVVNVPQISINDGVTNLGSRTGGSLAPTIIDMSAIAAVPAIDDGALPPVAYDVAIEHRDSASAAAASAIYATLRNPGSLQLVKADVRGVADSEPRVAAGRVAADASGNIEVQITATGASTATTLGRLLAVHR